MVRGRNIRPVFLGCFVFDRDRFLPSCLGYFDEFEFTVLMDKVDAAIKTLLDRELCFGLRQIVLPGDLKQAIVKAHSKIITHSALMLKTKD